LQRKRDVEELLNEKQKPRAAQKPAAETAKATAAETAKTTAAAFIRANRTGVAFIIIFALTVAAVPVSWIFARPPAFIELEKRYRTEWPGFSANAFLSGRWGERVGEWMTDNMPQREFLVGVEAYASYFAGRQAARDIYVDGDGGLVEAPHAYSADDLHKRIDKINEFTQSLGGAADTVVMTPPNAGYLAPLPTLLKQGYADDAIAGLLVNSNRLYEYVDLRSAFINHADRLYYRTDHHWNAEGAYAAYTALGGALGYAPLPRGDYAVETAGNFYGSVYAKSGLWLTGPDTLEMWSPPCRARASVIIPGSAPISRDSLFYTEFLTGWDMYSVFLGGINGITVIENLDATAKAAEATESAAGVAVGAAADTLYIIKDSFANSLIPLLLPHYKRIVAIDLRDYAGSVSELVTNAGAVDELLEAQTANGDSSYKNKNNAAKTNRAAVLIVYSMNRIVNDTDLLKLR
jgi:hypothetical protein